MYIPKIGDWLKNGDAKYVVESVNLDGERAVSMNLVLADDSDWIPEATAGETLILSVDEYRRDDWNVSTIEEREYDRVFEFFADSKLRVAKPESIATALDLPLASVRRAIEELLSGYWICSSDLPAGEHFGWNADGDAAREKAKNAPSITEKEAAMLCAIRDSEFRDGGDGEEDVVGVTVWDALLAFEASSDDDPDGAKNDDAIDWEADRRDREARGIDDATIVRMDGMSVEGRGDEIDVVDPETGEVYLTVVNGLSTYRAQGGDVADLARVAAKKAGVVFRDEANSPAVDDAIVEYLTGKITDAELRIRVATIAAAKKVASGGVEFEEASRVADGDDDPDLVARVEERSGVDGATELYFAGGATEEDLRAFRKAQEVVRAAAAEAGAGIDVDDLPESDVDEAAAAIVRLSKIDGATYRREDLFSTPATPEIDDMVEAAVARNYEKVAKLAVEDRGDPDLLAANLREDLPVALRRVVPVVDGMKAGEKVEFDAFLPSRGERFPVAIFYFGDAVRCEVVRGRLIAHMPTDDDEPWTYERTEEPPVVVEATKEKAGEFSSPATLAAYKDEVVDEAVDAMCASIQNALGSEDGGPASHYFSGENGDEIREVVGRYFDFERDWNEDAGEEEEPDEELRDYGVECEDCGGGGYVSGGVDGCGLCGGLGRRDVEEVISFADVKDEVDAALPSGVSSVLDYRTAYADLNRRHALDSVEEAREALVSRMIHSKRGREVEERNRRESLRARGC